MKILFIIVLTFFGLLTFTEKNNISDVQIDALNKAVVTEADTVSREEFREFLNKKLLAKMGDCYFKETQMTKCPEYVTFKLIDPYRKNPTCYKRSLTRGILYTEGCREGQTICEFRAIYDKNRLEVKESFFTDWVDADEFSTKFCKHVKTNR